VRCTVYQRCNEVRNLLTNASLESGAVSGWNPLGSVDVFGAYNSPAPHSGGWYLGVSTGPASGSVFQDIAVSPAVDSSYVFSVWVRASGSGCMTGTLVLYALGGTPESSGTAFNVCSATWRLVSAPLEVALTGHNQLRAQLYLDANKNVDIDTTEVIQVLGKNSSFERGQPGAGWSPLHWTRVHPPGNWGSAKKRDYAS
jgi:hypothetical protein